jgi:hypothetical protein
LGSRGQASDGDTRHGGECDQTSMPYRHEQLTRSSLRKSRHFKASGRKKLAGQMPGKSVNLKKVPD